MNSSIDLEMLESMRYSDLQKLAKSLGIKANMKMDRLLNALRDHVGGKTGKPTMAKTDSESDSATSESEREEPLKKPKQNEGKPRRGRKPKSSKGKDIKEVATEKEESKEPAPIPPKKFFASPKRVNSPAVKRFSVASRTPLMTSGVKRLSQVTPRGLKAKVNTPCTPASLQKPNKRQRTSTSEEQSSAKRRRKSTDAQTEEKTIKVTSKSSANKRQSNIRSSLPKRRSSGRLSNKGAMPGSDKQKQKSIRRRTFDKEEASPGVKDIIGSLKGDMTVKEMKESLLMSLDKKVKIAAKPEMDKPSSQIPRFAAYLAARKKQAEENKKPITPGNKDWAKLHEKRFNKMDSLAKYLDKRKGRQEAITNSTKKAQLIAEQTRSAIKSLKECRTPPTSVKKPFMPQVTSLAQVKTNFSTMKSPASAKKTTLAVPSSASKENKARKSDALQQRKSAVTPFKVGNLNTTHNTTMDSTIQSGSKTTFNLAASLAKPVTWKAHTGKLKPFSMGGLYQVREVRENKGNVKEVKVTTRDVRRNVAQVKRSDNRAAAQMKRRGIHA